MELLRTGDMQGLDALTQERPSAVRHLLGRLWDGDPLIRERAAVGIGNAAVRHPEIGIEFLRRFAWALNDESVTNGVYVIPAVAAIAIREPELARPFVGQLVGALDDPGLRQEAEKALERISCRWPELVDQYQDEIARKRDNDYRNDEGECPSSSEDNNGEAPWSKS